MKKTRLEAFSDAVIAIIITIMVLELPRPAGHDWHSLIRVWPTFFAYVLSFAYVGIHWNNHHHLFQAVQRVRGGVLWANMHFLFWLSLFPFVSGWAGESDFAPVPMICYAIVALCSALSLNILVRVIVRADASNHLLAEAVGGDLKGWLTIGAYSVAVFAPLFGRVGAVISGLILAGVALAWLSPDRRIERVLRQHSSSRKS